MGKFQKHSFFFTLALMSSWFVSAQASCPYSIYVGAESYHFTRIREGGTKQSGVINGTRLGLDRIKPHGWYVGVDYLYASGKIKGKAVADILLDSEVTDRIFEARIGFTLQQYAPKRPFITPFMGWGSFREVNAFTPPSPFSYKFTDTLNYAVVGFLSGVNITALISMGLDFKVKFMLDGKSKVTHDPMYEGVTLIMEKETFCRLDIPLTYDPCNALLGVDMQLVPFYEFRHFGGREGFPFNFKDTKFYLYGARLSLLYRF